jgi:leucyl aminopeptidase
MQVHLDVADPLSRPAPLLVVAVPRDARPVAGFLKRLDHAFSGAVSRVLEAGDLAGKAGEDVVLYGSHGSGAGPERVALVAVGEAGAYDAEQVRRFVARGVRIAERLHLDAFSCWLDGFGAVAGAELGQAAAEGAALAAWRFTELKKPPEDTPQVAVEEAAFFSEGDTEALEKGVAKGAFIAAAENFARTLQARPGNLATPSHLAAEAERVAVENGLAVTVFDEARLAKEGMNAILAVSQGSEEEARLIILEHHGGAKGDAPLVLVGKGVTFDAGGISIKPAASMDEMKFDMSAGAAVIAAMQALAQLGVKANVVGIVPSSENLPSGTALKPGDVIRTLAGKTVEVVNTDAEGRLLLADALAWGARMKPAAMVDCATLTGAVVIGLGHHAAAVLGTDDALVEELRAAGARSGERCWPLPLWDEYREQLDSETADLMNVGGRPAGTITAACFLREFVGDVPWAHLDVAGTAWGDGMVPYQRKGGYGFPTRLLVEWVLSRVG